MKFKDIFETNTNRAAKVSVLAQCYQAESRSEAKSVPEFKSGATRRKAKSVSDLKSDLG